MPVRFQHTAARRRLVAVGAAIIHVWMFQHTAARRRLGKWTFNSDGSVKVSTHSRPKAAGIVDRQVFERRDVSTHSRPKAAGLNPPLRRVWCFVSTHSRPKAAGPNRRSRNNRRRSFNTQPPEGGWGKRRYALIKGLSFNTQPPEGGWRPSNDQLRRHYAFQHTAARRRLVSKDKIDCALLRFQHTAARRRLELPIIGQGVKLCFNTQPPEGGWGQ